VTRLFLASGPQFTVCLFVFGSSSIRHVVMWIIDALPTHLIPFLHDDDHDRVHACAYHSQANNLSLGSQTNGECSVERERERVCMSSINS
jgi:hypothetical protein